MRTCCASCLRQQPALLSSLLRSFFIEVAFARERLVFPSSMPAENRNASASSSFPPPLPSPLLHLPPRDLFVEWLWNILDTPGPSRLEFLNIQRSVVLVKHADRVRHPSPCSTLFFLRDRSRLWFFGVLTRIIRIIFPIK